MNQKQKHNITKKFFCKRCDTEVKIPDFPPGLKQEIKDMVIKYQSLNAINKIRNSSELGLLYKKTLLAPRQ